MQWMSTTVEIICKEMVKKINDEKPATARIFINMKVVEKLPHKTNTADEDELDSGDDNGLEVQPMWAFFS
jgi:hypothetical protein